MTGSFAYLSRHEELIPQMIAGVNLDMVGGDQSLNGSVMLLERPPDSASSFVPDLLERLREELFEDGTSHTGLGAVPLFRYATTSFSGGSDHYIFSDPTVGVPMAMLIQWPDRFYHTSADTLDKIDPGMLCRAGCLAAAFAVFVANAQEAEATWLAFEVAARFQARLARQIQAQVTQMWDGAVPAAMDDLERRTAYELDRHGEVLGSLKRLWPGAGPLVAQLLAEAANSTRSHLDSLRGAIEARAVRLEVDDPGPEADDEWEHRAAVVVPRRRYRGPADVRGHRHKISPADYAEWFSLVKSRPSGGWTLPTLADYWADGRRTVLEIVDLVEMESGIRDAELIVKRFELLHKLGLVDLDPVGDA
jgi:aminopeptidase YwaD